MPRTANPQTRAKLLDAAEELMLRKGFAAASVDDICASARVTKGSFFHYFKNKDVDKIHRAIRKIAQRDSTLQAFLKLD